jgi:hypothetical protein
VSQGAFETFEVELLELSRCDGRDVGIQPSVGDFKMQRLPQDAESALDADLRNLPQDGHLVGIRTPDLHRVSEVPRGPGWSLDGCMCDLPHADDVVPRLAPRRVLDLHHMSHRTRRASRGRMHHMPRDRVEVGLRAPRSDSRLHRVTHRTRRASHGRLHHLPRHRRQVGVHAPCGDSKLRRMPYGTHPALGAHLRELPLRRYDVGLLTPERVIDLRNVSHGACRTSRRRLQHVPRDRVNVGLHTSQLDRVRHLPHRSGESLRDNVCFVPQPIPCVGGRDVQPPRDFRRRTHVQELLLRVMPPERLLLGDLHQVPRQHQRW